MTAETVVRVLIASSSSLSKTQWGDTGSGEAGVCINRERICTGVRLAKRRDVSVSCTITRTCRAEARWDARPRPWIQALK